MPIMGLRAPLTLDFTFDCSDQLKPEKGSEVGQGQILRQCIGSNTWLVGSSKNTLIAPQWSSLKETCTGVAARPVSNAALKSITVTTGCDKVTSRAPAAPLLSQQIASFIRARAGPRSLCLLVAENWGNGRRHGTTNGGNGEALGTVFFPGSSPGQVGPNEKAR
jgi:hypothetical protein